MLQSKEIGYQSGEKKKTNKKKNKKKNKKQEPSICCPQETHFRPEDTYRLKVKEWRAIYYANECQKKAGISILISDKLDFKTKTEGHLGGSVG